MAKEFSFNGQKMSHWTDGFYHYWEWHEGYDNQDHFIAIGLTGDFMQAIATQLHTPVKAGDPGEWQQTIELRRNLEAVEDQLSPEDHAFVCDCVDAVLSWEAGELDEF